MLNVGKKRADVGPDIVLARTDDAIIPARWVIDLGSGFLMRCHSASITGAATGVNSARTRFKTAARG